jgi:hypothetical protein
MIAQNKYNFMHNDLWTRNVRIRYYSTSQYKISTYKKFLGFQYNKKALLTKYTPVILDFGRSTVKYNNEIICSFDSSGWNKCNKNNDYFNHFSDILVHNFELLLELIDNSYHKLYINEYQTIKDMLFGFFINNNNELDLNYLKNIYWIIKLISDLENKKLGRSDIYRQIYRDERNNIDIISNVYTMEHYSTWLYKKYINKI